MSEFGKLRASVSTWSTYQRAGVLAWFTCQRAYVSTCQKRDKFSYLRVNVPKGLPICQTFLLRNVKGNFYILLYEKFYILLDIIVINITCTCIVNKICVMLYFYTSCHIKEKCVEFFFFIIFVFFALQSEIKIKRPGFYTLQVTRVSSNFPQLQLSKIKNTYVRIQ